MSLFWRAREQRRALTAADFASGIDMPGSPLSGMSLATPEGSLRLAPVYAAVRLIADAVAGLPLQALRERPDGTRVRATGPSLLDDPAPTGTTFDWVHRAVTSCLLSGNAIGIEVAWRAGWPTAVQWLDPDEVQVHEGEGRAELFYEGRPLAGEPIVHIPAMVLPGRVWGVSPIRMHQLTVESGILAARFGRDWFRNGSVPSAILESEQMVDKDTATILKQRFKEAAAGRDVVALGAGAKYKPISIPANESQFIETQQLTATQIAHIFGVPPEMVGGTSGDSMTYANVESRASHFVTFTLRPWLVRLEQAFTRLLPRGQVARFAADALLRADTLTRHQAHDLAIQGGWKTPDEVRALENLPPLPGGQGATVRPSTTTAAAQPPTA